MPADNNQMVGGILQDFITKFIKDYLVNLKPDLSKLDVAMNKQGFGLWADSFKNIISGTLDDTFIDGVKTAYNSLLDHLVSKQPIPMGGPIYTALDAQNFLATLPSAISPEGKAKLLEHPQLLEILKEKCTPEQAVHILNTPQSLDRLINFLIEWGPFFAKIALAFLPLLFL